jgi:hypothetical protein
MPGLVSAAPVGDSMQALQGSDGRSVEHHMPCPRIGFGVASLNGEAGARLSLPKNIIQLQALDFATSQTRVQGQDHRVSKRLPSMPELPSLKQSFNLFAG